MALERDGNNSLLRRYAYGLTRISMTTGGSSYCYAYDRLANSTAVDLAASLVKFLVNFPLRSMVMGGYVDLGGFAPLSQMTTGDHSSRKAIA